MIDRIRDLLDRPLDRRHAQAIVAIASCLTLTFAALVGLGGLGHSDPIASPRRDDSAQPTPPPRTAAHAADHPSPRPKGRPKPLQDPQDRRGTPAYRRARRTARDHRALQHLPFRRKGLSIVLSGADRGRAVIRIVAPTLAEARQRWRGFLRRFGDDGSAYEARFRAASRPGITGRRKDAGRAAEGAAGPDGAGEAGTRAIRHHERDRAARSFLRSKPHPKASP